MRKLLQWRAVSCLILAIGASVGIESATSASAATPKTQSSAHSQIASGNPIVIGTICSCSGAGASSDGLIPTEVTAWIDYVNHHGGLNGHPVKVIVKDDGVSPATALQNAKILIQQDHVMAIVGEESLVDTEWASYVEKEGVPVVGGQPFDPPMWTSADFFPTGGGIIPATYGAVSQMKKHGDTKVGLLFCAEAPACAGNPPFFKKMFATLPSLHGMSLVYTSEISASAPSYTAQCLAAKGAGATALFINTFPSAVVRVVDTCVQQGEKFAEYNAGGDVGPLVWKDPNAAGTIATEYNVPVGDTQTAGAKLFDQIMAKYAPSVNPSSPDWNDNLIGTFAGLQMFETVADASHLTPSSTPTAVKTALWKVHGQTLGGLAPAITYNKNKPTELNCWFDESFINEKQTEPSGPAPQCVPASETTALYKAF